jgi:hypothetical protein
MIAQATRSPSTRSSGPRSEPCRAAATTYARSSAFYDTTLFWQWMRISGDVVFALGAPADGLIAWDFIVKLRPLFPRFVARLIPGSRLPLQA